MDTRKSAISDEKGTLKSDTTPCHRVLELPPAAPSAGISENRADLIESSIPSYDARVVGPYWVSNPLYLTALTSKSED